MKWLLLALIWFGWLLSDTVTAQLVSTLPVCLQRLEEEQQSFSETTKDLTAAARERMRAMLTTARQAAERGDVSQCREALYQYRAYHLLCVVGSKEMCPEQNP